MPYRRLPNTDTARLKALKTAYIIAKELPPFKLAFSQSTFQKIQSFLPLFEKNVSESKFTYANQVKRSKDYQLHLRKAHDVYFSFYTGNEHGYSKRRTTCINTHIFWYF